MLLRPAPSPADKDYTLHRLILGTHTSGSDRNFLHIASVALPKSHATTSASSGSGNAASSNSNGNGASGSGSGSGSGTGAGAASAEGAYDTTTREIGEYSDTQPRIKIIQSINHDGEVNRARYMPQNPDIIATKTASGEVHVFDRTKHPTLPKEGDDKAKPDITLRGHSKEGCAAGPLSLSTRIQCDASADLGLTWWRWGDRYGLAWNAAAGGEGHLLSGSEDTTVCHW